MPAQKPLSQTQMLKAAVAVTGAVLLIAACNGNRNREPATIGTAGSCTAGTDAPFAMDLTVAQSDSLIDANSGNDCFTILDVRTEDEYNQGHLEGAVRYDYRAGELHDALDSLDKHRAYMVYCRSGNRSAHAVEDMKDAGFTALYNMLGGFNDWTGAGLPAAK